ncbi:phosphoribosylglycinamide formyltransferase [Candidatus Woesearchaeota archaeon]|nr:phosphoribosylglycinamide formyltransferase [Candidatus Woesearchaeota archaeon]
MRLAVLASTKATDMQAIIDAINDRKLDAEISIVISDKKDAYALERAKNHGIKAVFIDYGKFGYIKDKEQRREAFDREIAKALDKEKVDLILLIGYMKFLSKWFTQQYKNKIMNIHPSLLPKFAGGMDKDVHRAVLDAGERVTGCTLHFVDESPDGGPIILQKEVRISLSDDAQSLKEKVQKAEQEIILKGIRLFAQGKLAVKGKKAIIKN